MGNLTIQRLGDLFRRQAGPSQPRRGPLVLGRHNFIVYQFGKVASTSIVNSLNDLEGVSAYQCHFLGEKSFLQVLRQMSDPDVENYFYNHLEGQLFANMRLQREINKFRDLRYPEKSLHFVSVARDPVEVARSSLIQDIYGYLNSFVTIWGRGEEPRSEFVVSSVTRLLELYIDFLRTTNVATMENMLPTIRYVEDLGYKDPGGKLLAHLLQVLHRPLLWYREQLCKYLSIQLKDIRGDSDALFYRDLGWSDCFVFKYEELEAGLTGMLAALDMRGEFSFSMDNVSSQKSFSEEINRCFTDEVCSEIRALQKESEYCQLFGY